MWAPSQGVSRIPCLRVCKLAGLELQHSWPYFLSPFSASNQRTTQRRSRPLARRRVSAPLGWLAASWWSWQLWHAMRPVGRTALLSAMGGSSISPRPGICRPSGRLLVPIAVELPCRILLAWLVWALMPRPWISSAPYDETAALMESSEHGRTTTPRVADKLMHGTQANAASCGDPVSDGFPPSQMKCV
jgi:hypothetical protein